MNTIAANAASVSLLAPGRAGEAASGRAPESPARQLGLRVVSAAVLVPLALAAVHLGYPWFELLIAVLAVAMALEWSRLTLRRGRNALGMTMGAAAVLAVAAAGAGRVGVAFLVLAGGLLAVLAAAALFRAADWKWALAGTLYIAVPCLAVVWMREGPAAGRELLIWLLIVVWTTDVAAYAVGRGIGGPRLAPRVSPGKTWSGLIGGMAGAGLVSAAAATWLGLAAPLPAAAIGAALAAVAQAGDLAESGVKRRFGAKDSGALIPGHGGVLDRLDGMLAAAPAAAAIVWMAGGGIPEWR